MAYTLKRPDSKISPAAYRFAIISGLQIFLVMGLGLYVLHAIGFQTYSVHPIWLDVILLGGMVWACFRYRKNTNLGPVLTTRQAYILSVFIGITVAFLYLFFAAFYIEYLHPEIISEYIVQQGQNIQAADISESERLSALQQLPQVSNWQLASFAFGELLLISAFAPLVLSMFVRSER